MCNIQILEWVGPIFVTQSKGQKCSIQKAKEPGTKNLPEARFSFLNLRIFTGFVVFHSQSILGIPRRLWSLPFTTLEFIKAWAEIGVQAFQPLDSSHPNPLKGFGYIYLIIQSFSLIGKVEDIVSDHWLFAGRWKNRTPLIFSKSTRVLSSKMKV